MENFNHYNKKLKPLAHANRYQMTKAEACLWKYVLSAKKMFGYSFNRQRPIDNFIVDFYCKPLQLAIEVDGISHTFDDVVEKDMLKQQHLEKLGISILRFSDEAVLNDIENVRMKIEGEVRRLERS
jgi:very-short-patch-repair endonuclease